MLVMNDKGMEQLLSSKFQISGEGSAAAGPVGRHASAGTDWKLDTEMLTYSRSKGAFAGLTLEGAVIQQDNDSTTAIYGKDVTFKNPFCWVKFQRQKLQDRLCIQWVQRFMSQRKRRNNSRKS